METIFIVAHNHNGYAYIREVLESSTTVYADCELGSFSTLAEAERFVAEVDPQLDAEWEAQLDAEREAQREAQGGEWLPARVCGPGEADIPHDDVVWVGINQSLEEAVSQFEQDGFRFCGWL